MPTRTRTIGEFNKRDLIQLPFPVKIISKLSVDTGKYHLILEVTLNEFDCFTFNDESHEKSHRYMEFPSDCDDCAQEERDRSGDTCHWPIMGRRPVPDDGGNIIDHRWSPGMDPIGEKDSG